MNSSFQKCDLCGKTILPGQRYGSVTFNIETFVQTEEEPDGIIDIHHSANVTTLCIDCASKFNNKSIRQFLD